MTDRTAPQLFEDFAESAAETSPLYRSLALSAAKDSATCAVMDDAPQDKRTGVLFFDAVRYLLLQGAGAELENDYRRGNDSADDPRVAQRLSKFCADHHDEIVELMRSRTVQANEVNRCVAILLGLSVVHAECDDPVAFVEVGASGGLNLEFDRYHYDFSDGRSIGDDSSDVRLATELRGELQPPASDLESFVTTRFGIDIEPVPLDQPDNALWLQACVWPGTGIREERLDGALRQSRQAGHEVVKGDVATDLESVVHDRVKPNEDIVVFSSWTLSWMSKDDRVLFIDCLKNLASANRTVWLITLESAGVVDGLVPEPDLGRPSLLGLHRHANGQSEARLLAVAQHHCNWIEWRDQKSAVDL